MQHHPRSPYKWNHDPPRRLQTSFFQRTSASYNLSRAQGKFASNHIPFCLLNIQSRMNFFHSSKGSFSKSCHSYPSYRDSTAMQIQQQAFLSTGSHSRTHNKRSRISLPFHINRAYRYDHPFLEATANLFQPGTIYRISPGYHIHNMHHHKSLLNFHDRYCTHPY